MARNHGLRLPVLSLPILLFAAGVQGAVARQSARALARLTPGQISTVSGMPYPSEAGFGHSGDGGAAADAEMFAPQRPAIDAPEISTSRPAATTAWDTQFSVVDVLDVAIELNKNWT